MLCVFRFGWHSLTAAYGIAPEKVIFIPHGVVLPQSTERSTRDRHLLEQMMLRRLRSSTNASLGMPNTFLSTDYRKKTQGLPLSQERVVWLQTSFIAICPRSVLDSLV